MPEIYNLIKDLHELFNLLWNDQKFQFDDAYLSDSMLKEIERKVLKLRKLSAVRKTREEIGEARKSLKYYYERKCILTSPEIEDPMVDMYNGSFKNNSLKEERAFVLEQYNYYKELNQTLSAKLPDLIKEATLTYA